MAKSYRGLAWYQWLVVSFFGVWMFLTTGTGIGEGIGGGLVGLAVGYVIMRATSAIGSSGGEEEQAAD